MTPAAILDVLVMRWRTRLGGRRGELDGFVERHRSALEAELVDLTRRASELVTRYVGQCAICEGEFKLTLEHHMVHHGYRRPGWGHIVGDCMGVGEPPYEVSCEITKTYRAVLEQQKSSTEGWLGRLERGEVGELRVRQRPGVPEVVMTPADPMWGRSVDWAIMEARSELRKIDREIERITRLIDAWVPRPLRTVEEVKGATRAERDMKAAKRAEEKAAKIAAKVASYQARLATAVRRKTASTIAEIFESAPRQLGDMAHKSRREVFAMLDRNQVFTAFGLDPGTSSDAEPNAAILSRMRYNFDQTFVWPEQLRPEAAKS